jgi:hypothetical protein
MLSCMYFSCWCSVWVTLMSLRFNTTKRRQFLYRQYVCLDVLAIIGIVDYWLHIHCETKGVAIFGFVDYCLYIERETGGLAIIRFVDYCLYIQCETGGLAMIEFVDYCLYIHCETGGLAIIRFVYWICRLDERRFESRQRLGLSLHH